MRVSMVWWTRKHTRKHENNGAGNEALLLPLIDMTNTNTQGHRHTHTHTARGGRTAKSEQLGIKATTVATK